MKNIFKVILNIGFLVSGSISHAQDETESYALRNTVTEVWRKASELSSQLEEDLLQILAQLQYLYSSKRHCNPNII